MMRSPRASPRGKQPKWRRGRVLQTRSGCQIFGITLFPNGLWRLVAPCSLFRTPNGMPGPPLFHRHRLLRCWVDGASASSHACLSLCPTTATKTSTPTSGRRTNSARPRTITSPSSRSCSPTTSTKVALSPWRRCLGRSSPRTITDIDSSSAASWNPLSGAQWPGVTGDVGRAGRERTRSRGSRRRGRRRPAGSLRRSGSRSWPKKHFAWRRMMMTDGSRVSLQGFRPRLPGFFFGA
mmetsp:Transcript_117066/g.278082  ORF Transcript_117066/g.278082 Transcript_117066/m.278082 type:complete len:237 (-) Transcript_117066:161-871(-)